MGSLITPFNLAFGNASAESIAAAYIALMTEATSPSVLQGIHNYTLTFPAVNDGNSQPGPGFPVREA